MTVLVLVIRLCHRDIDVSYDNHYKSWICDCMSDRNHQNYHFFKNKGIGSISFVRIALDLRGITRTGVIRRVIIVTEELCRK